MLAMEFNGYLMSGDLEIAQISNGQVLPRRKNLMPLYLAAGGKLEDWLTSRAIDRHRPNSRILKKVLRLTNSGDLAAVLRTHAATITDNYWVKEDHEADLTYEQVQFTQDTFSEIALTGSFTSYSKQYTEKQLAENSPELTNIGSYEKCWKIDNGNWWMHKAGNALERFSELFIARLGKELGFCMAEYLPSGDFVKTLDFTKGLVNYEPVAAIVGEEEDYAFNYDKLTALKPELGKQYLDILFLDALCFNMDRHTENYGVLRDRETGEILGMAPNFDNNIALIAKGYGGDPLQTNGLLMDMFIELLEERDLAYPAPAIDLTIIRDVAEQTLPEVEIDREYVISMVTERWQRLTRKLEQNQRCAPQQQGTTMRFL